MPGGVIPWRHGPIVAGDAATPDQPLWVLAPYLLEPGVLAGSSAAGTHGEDRLGVNVMPSPDRQGTHEERPAARQGLPAPKLRCGRSGRPAARFQVAADHPPGWPVSER